MVDCRLTVPGSLAQELTRISLIIAATTAAPMPRHKTVAVRVGKVTVGGGAPVVVQSMTNTDTADIDSTVRQVAALARAGSENRNG